MESIVTQSLILSGLMLWGAATHAQADSAPSPHAPTLTAPPSPPRGTGPGASRQAWAAAAGLSRGINLAVFAAPREGDWGLRMDDRWIDTLAKAGFRSVRLSVRWSNHAATSPDAALDEAFAKRIDRLIDTLLSRNLRVVVNQSFYNQLDGRPVEDGELPVAPSAVRPRFLNLWRQLALRYAHHSDRLLFELYNVPKGDDAKAWNDLIADTLAVVRPSNPRRIIVIPALRNEASELTRLVLPRDPYLIATIHNREPRQFTFQGSPWLPESEKWLGTLCCDAEQQQALARNLDIAATWSTTRGYPVWLGSFGAASTAPMPARANYLRSMREAAEARGISWAHTDFAANFNVREPPLDSGIYNVIKRQWHPSLRHALLGP